MTARGTPRLLALGAAAVLLVTCQTVTVYGPYDIEGWVEQCEEGCSQQKSCDYPQFLYDHGNLTNCRGSCSYRLDREENELFLDETPGACVEALWAEVRCVFDLGCADLDDWEEGAAGFPCEEEATSRAAACEGLDVEAFLGYCDLPEQVDGAG